MAASKIWGKKWEQTAFLKTKPHKVINMVPMIYFDKQCVSTTWIFLFNDNVRSDLILCVQ